jgi:PilZ domain-containing protein
MLGATMMATPTHPLAVSGAERRREKRYEVQLRGEMGVEGEIRPVSIGDLSGSGALVMMTDPPDQGTVADLWIAGFGDVEIKIMFCGEDMCGVMFTRPAEHRDRLLKWLTGEMAEDKGKA